MTLELFSGILIFLAICIVPCIPLGYLLYRFLRELITIIKRNVAETKWNEGSEERAGWFKEYLQEQLQKQEKIEQDETLTGSGNIVYVVLAVLFPVMHVLVKAVFAWGALNDGNATITIFAMLMFVLVGLVLGVLGLDAKNPKTKFLLELVPTIGLELMVAFSMYYLFNRDGLIAARAIKSIGMMLIVGIPFFLKYAIKTQENWLRMRNFAQIGDKA